MTEIFMSNQKRIALIAHDGKKDEMVAWCEKHQEELIESMHKMRDDIKKEDVVALFLFYDFNKLYLENNNIDNVWEEIGYWRFNMNIDVVVSCQHSAISNQQCETFHVRVDRINRKSLHCVINEQPYEVLLSQNGGGINKVIINGIPIVAVGNHSKKNHGCKVAGKLLQ